jgi:hypothetical protein
MDFNDYNNNLEKNYLFFELDLKKCFFAISKKSKVEKNLF